MLCARSAGEAHADRPGRPCQRSRCHRPGAALPCTNFKVVEFGRAPVEFESTRMCELLVGLPDVNVLAVVDVAGANTITATFTRAIRSTALATTCSAAKHNTSPSTTRSASKSTDHWRTGDLR